MKVSSGKSALLSHTKRKLSFTCFRICAALFCRAPCLPSQPYHRWMSAPWLQATILHWQCLLEFSFMLLGKCCSVSRQQKKASKNACKSQCSMENFTATPGPLLIPNCACSILIASTISLAAKNSIACQQPIKYSDTVSLCSQQEWWTDGSHRF